MPSNEKTIHVIYKLLGDYLFFYCTYDQILQFSMEELEDDTMCLMVEKNKQMTTNQATLCSL